MAFSKKNEFAGNLRNIAEFSRALAHPARVAILTALAEKDTCVCGEIVNVIPLAQSTVSQHLKALKEAGLIRGEIEGPKSCYCINYETFQELAACMNQFLHAIGMKQKSNCC